jgi:hypothetical protein
VSQVKGDLAQVGFFDVVIQDKLKVTVVDLGDKDDEDDDLFAMTDSDVEPLAGSNTQP